MRVQLQFLYRTFPLYVILTNNIGQYKISETNRRKSTSAFIKETKRSEQHLRLVNEMENEF